MPLTATGANGRSAVPAPSDPYALSPQHAIVPDLRIAHVWPAAALIATASVRPLTGPGAGFSFSSSVLPFPSAYFAPQHHTAPDFRSEQTNSLPTETAIASSIAFSTTIFSS